MNQDNHSQNLSKKIEAILFWKAEPVSFKKLAQLLSYNKGTDSNIEEKVDNTEVIKVIESDVKSAVLELENSLKGRGITLIQTDEEVSLGTAKEYSPLIEQMTKEELSRDIGKAGLEVLSIILYQGPISRTDIDYIRGVNSQFIVRNLLVRGLVERVNNPKDSRSFLYKPSLDLLANLGVSKISDLPEFEKVRSDIENFKQHTDPTTDTENKSDATIE